MSYWKHTAANLKVAKIGLFLTIFHFIHALIPIKQTSHDYWGITFGPVQD